MAKFKCTVHAARMRVGTVPVLLLLLALHLSESLLLPGMPARSVVHCPGCPRQFSSEKGLRRHHGQSARYGTSCQYQAANAPLISLWAPGGAGPVGRVSVLDMGPGMYDSDGHSPEPGDDLRDPPPDFDEDALGGPAPAPPAPVPPPAAVPVAPVRTIHLVSIYTEYTSVYRQYKSIHAIRVNTGYTSIYMLYKLIRPILENTGYTDKYRNIQEYTDYTGIYRNIQKYTGVYKHIQASP